MFDINLLVPKIIWLLSAFTLASHLAIASLIVAHVFGLHKKEFFQKYFSIIRRRGLLLAFLVSLLATAGSLFFSEIANLEPCKLCWWQRIFLYPQVIILALAFWQKDYGSRSYVIPLSLIGAGIAGYQYISTWLAPVSPFGICSTGGPSCLTNYFTSFGYITSPLMSFTGFALIIIFLFIGKEYNN